MEPLDVRLSGIALNSDGFLATYFSLSGLALNTFGFLVGCADIWVTSENVITTTWTSIGSTSLVENCID